MSENREPSPTVEIETMSHSVDPQVGDSVIAPGVREAHNEESHLFAPRPTTASSMTSEQAFMSMLKGMLGVGVLSLPLAFKRAGLYLGLILLTLICIVCLRCMRMIVFAAHFVCSRNGRETIDYANIMRGAVEAGPPWIRRHGYLFKQLVNFNIFVTQLGFTCVYFVFMSDNLQDFFVKIFGWSMPKSLWMLLIAIPVLAFCSIRRLNKLAPFALVANVVYLSAVAIVVYFFFTNLKPSATLTKWGSWTDLPFFFGTVTFAFEGVAVVMVVENRMRKPDHFIAWNGVLNSSCLVVLAIFAVTGFYGYLAVGDDVKDTVTLNMPDEPFYQILKIMFVLCILVSYPIQFFVPLERVEKFITRKCPTEKHTQYIYAARYSIVLLTLAIAELIPHLALFISLIGAIACSTLALLLPPIIDLLCAKMASDRHEFIDQLCDFVNKTVRFVDFPIIRILAENRCNLISNTWIEECAEEDVCSLMLKLKDNEIAVYPGLETLNDFLKSIMFFSLWKYEDRTPTLRSSYMIDGVKPNKCLQIQYFGEFLSSVCSKYEIHRLVDIGCGIGHLLGWLSKRTQLELIGIDRDDGLCKKGAAMYPEVKFHNVDCTLESTFKELIAVPDKRTAVVSLHGCGDVQETLIRGFCRINSDEVPILITVGCCYHKITNIENNAWMMSRTVKNKLSVQFNACSLRTATESDYKTYINGNESTRKNRVFSCVSRAIVEVFYERMGIDASKDLRSRRRKLGATFEEVKLELISRYKVEGEERELWSRTLDEILNEFKSQIPLIAPLLDIQHLLQGPFERLIYADRISFLEEQGIDVEMKQVFPRELSPRNLLLIASRQSTST
ncbi:Aa-trans domain-containing protein [Aphelenchoides besseyi]|nr:Aa-trans domain-containing protein [Aphelenchoides besseyi]